MASKDSSDEESKGNFDREKTFDIGDTGHTMSESSSDESNKENRSRSRPERRMRKFVIEKRPRSSSSDASASENKKLKQDLDQVYDLNTAGEYPNPMGHPRIQLLLWNEITGENLTYEG